MDFKKVKSTVQNKVDNIVLTEAEVELLWDMDLDGNKGLQSARDILLFSIYTGQRWGDVSSFHKDQLNGKTWDFISEKTGDHIYVPFVGFAERAYEILERYDFALPRITMHRYNYYLKELGKKAGIDEEVTIRRASGKSEIVITNPKYSFMSSHMARRTCVTILLQRGVPPTTVMKLTGHRDLRTLMKYENTNVDELARALQRVSHSKSKK
jgi:integrase